MCKVRNRVGSLTSIRKHFTQNKIDDFNSLAELLAFRDNYANARQQIISDHESRMTKERNQLASEVLQLENEVSANKVEIQQRLIAEIKMLRKQSDDLIDNEKSYFQEITYSFRITFLAIKIKYKELFFNRIVSSSVKPKAEILSLKNNRFQYLIANFDKAVEESSRLLLYEHDRKKRAVDEINHFIYGAIGEQRVVNELKRLSDEYILINDFCYSFVKPIFYHETKQYIKTIQIDHLLISAAGIFLIETKNWSNDSLKNLNLRSPVEQIKRTNYALFKILSGNSGLNLTTHHWGERKIPIRNLIVLINQKPPGEFHYVKVLTLNQLLGYIGYFKPILPREDTENMANYLMMLDGRN